MLNGVTAHSGANLDFSKGGFSYEFVPIGSVVGGQSEDGLPGNVGFKSWHEPENVVVFCFSFQPGEVLTTAPVFSYYREMPYLWVCFADVSKGIAVCVKR